MRFILLIVLSLVLMAQTAPTPTPTTPSNFTLANAVVVRNVGGGGSYLFLAQYDISDSVGRRAWDLYYLEVLGGGYELAAGTIGEFVSGDDLTAANNRGFEKGLVSVLVPARVVSHVSNQRLTMSLKMSPEAQVWPSGSNPPAAVSISPIEITESGLTSYALGVLRNVQEDWGVELLDGSALTDEGHAYIQAAAPILLQVTSLGQVNEVALAERVVIDETGNQNTDLSGAWQVEEGINDFASLLGVPVAILTTIAFLVFTFAFTIAFRQQLGVGGAAAGAAVVFTTGIAIGATTGFIPMNSLLAIIALVGLAAVGYLIKKAMP